jgi:hypothetical protein
MAARTIRESPDYRYFLVRTPRDFTCAEPAFLFFADDSDVSDLTTSLPTVLPLPPTSDGRGAAFIVLPSREPDRERIAETYPGAGQTELLLAGGHSLWVYRVEQEELRRVYELTGD